MTEGSLDVFKNLDERQAGYLEELKEYLRIPSVSTDPEYKDDVLRCSKFLLEKLEGPRDGCGDRMPLVGFLNDAELACVRDWVREQAMNARGQQP